MSRDGLRGYLARVASWYRRGIDGALVATYPPVPVVTDVQSLGHWPDIPPLKGIVEAPTFGPDGSLLTAPGYHPSAQLWFHCEPGFAVPPVSQTPSADEVRAARDLLLDELLRDFPFVDEASRAHALAAMLLPFVRDLVDGLTPLHVVEAPTPGTGKGLLVEVICIPATGRGAEVMAEGRDDDEWRKRITAALVKGSPFILIDNVSRRLDSGALAAALTATPAWTDRILGQSVLPDCEKRGNLDRPR